MVLLLIVRPSPVSYTHLIQPADVARADEAAAALVLPHQLGRGVRAAVVAGHQAGAIAGHLTGLAAWKAVAGIVQDAQFEAQHRRTHAVEMGLVLVGLQHGRKAFAEAVELGQFRAQPAQQLALGVAPQG